ncbi:hypothetical protein BCR43DRAFT_340053 [Syncephalastrum racemosum]|uniref:Uncharacterized protein n=1 Tax=Syncephalastrum racemosum TaxID=13706 RepID=A0A1X2H8Y5_SYNRA|nr:hypothetical protein BCR43DRAFT_340053 [Syncephalastrum racemosum]
MVIERCACVAALSSFSFLPAPSSADSKSWHMSTLTDFDINMPFIGCTVKKKGLAKKISLFLYIQDNELNSHMSCAFLTRMSFNNML